MTMRVELVSPERILFSGEADMIIARTVDGGDIAFLDGHAPFLGALEIATVTVRSSLGDELVAVHGGFIEVSRQPDDDADDGKEVTKVTILSDIAELGSQIDVNRARKAKEEAQAKLQHDNNGTAEAEMRRAHVRLAAADAL